MLKSSSDWPIREWIELVGINQYDRLQSEQSMAGSKTILAGRGDGRKSKSPHLTILYAPAQVIRHKDV